MDLLYNELRAVYVHPSAGRRGVGARILQKLEKLTTERGVEHLALDASLNAEAFYTRHGYEAGERTTHEFHSGASVSCIKMTKQLA